MNKRIPFSAMIVVALSMLSMAADTKTAPTTLPSEVTQLQASVKTWVNSLRGKTERQILDLLGKESDRSKWHSGDSGGLELKFKLDDAILDVLFSDDQVVYVTYTINSGI